MAHVEDLQIAIGDQGLLDWLHLGISQLVADKIELADRDFDEERRQDLARYLVVVDVKFREVAVLDGVYELLSSTVVNLIVLKLNLSQSWASVDQVTDHDTALGCQTVFRQVERVQLLFLLVFESCGHNSDTFITDSIATKVQLSDSLRALQHAFKLTETFNANIVLSEGEHLKVALLSQRFAQGLGALGENTIA